MRGDRLRELRKARGLSQAALAERIGISPAAIDHYENNRRKPTGEILIQLAAFFNVSSEYLNGDTDNPARAVDTPSDWQEIIAFAQAEGFSVEEVKKALKLYSTVKQMER